MAYTVPGWFLASLCLLCSEKLPANLCLPRQSRLLLSWPYLQESPYHCVCFLQNKLFGSLLGSWHRQVVSCPRELLHLLADIVGTICSQLLIGCSPLITKPSSNWKSWKQGTLKPIYIGFSGFYHKLYLFDWKHSPSPEATQRKMSWLHWWLSWHLITHVLFPTQALEPSPSASEGTVTVFLCQATRITRVGDCA